MVNPLKIKNIYNKLKIIYYTYFLSINTRLIVRMFFYGSMLINFYYATSIYVCKEIGKHIVVIYLTFLFVLSVQKILILYTVYFKLNGA